MDNEKVSHDESVEQPGADSRQVIYNDERRARLDALSHIARNQLQANPPDSEDSAQRRPSAVSSHISTHIQGTSTASKHAATRRMWLVALTVAIIVMIVASAIFSNLSRGSKGASVASTASLSILPSNNALQCVHGIAWSPNGQSLAMLGNAAGPDGCAVSNPSAYSYLAGLIQVYNTKTGKIQQSIQPDPLIQQDLGLHAPPTSAIQKLDSISDVSQQVIDYQAIGWSATGNQLALLFSIHEVLSKDGQGAYQTKDDCGILLTNPVSDAHNARILSHTLAAGESCSFAWNIAQSTYLALRQPVQSAQAGWLQSPTIQQAAANYQWQQDSLQPLQTPGGAANRSIGSPLSDASFSVWQPGQISVQTLYRGADGKARSDVPGVQTFSTGFIAWSPDGAIVSLVALNGWRFEPQAQQTPSAQTLEDFGLADAPVLPIRDQALAQILSQSPATHPNVAGIVSTVAWRPDGRFLASPITTQPDADPNNPDPAHHQVVIYDTSSGKLIAHLHITIAPGGANAGVFLQWSPDGSHLAYFDASLGVLVIWGPSQLPH